MSARHPETQLTQMLTDIALHQPNCAALQSLWAYNMGLLSQAVVMIERLKLEANADFNYAQAVGPHARHIIEHYQALLKGLDGLTALNSGAGHRIDYDGRLRDLALQSQPDVTLASLREIQGTMRSQCFENPLSLSLDTSVHTVFQVGLQGEIDVVTHSTLGRELLFVGSHTVHHFALMAHYCKLAGVDLGADFGKAPSTVAFERKH